MKDSLPQWAQKWADAATAPASDLRLERGREIAEKGHSQIDVVQAGAIGAAMTTPHGRIQHLQVLTIPTLPSQRATYVVVETLRRFPRARRELAEGRMPEVVLQALDKANLPLLIRPYPPLPSACTCEDTEAMCSHACAAHLEAARAFGKDPTLIMKARGIRNNVVLEEIKEELEEFRQRQEETQQPTIKPDYHAFWNKDFMEVPIPEMRAPTSPAPLVRRLGAFPEWESSLPLEDTMERISQQTTRAVLRMTQDHAQPQRATAPIGESAGTPPPDEPKVPGAEN